MVRSRQRTTNRGSTSSDIMLVAVKEVLDGKMSLRAISRKHNIDHTTLIRYYKKYNNAPNSALSTFRVGYSVKQVGAIVLQERGQMVTWLLQLMHWGTVPAAFVFPRVHYKDNFIRGGPPGSLGLAHPSGWMTEINFL
ncbi:hypothetical protein HELRODRAFT_176158 [Helobdella robusta]|uniref:HTH psq-type domain-containing protein n=1 Tax=Helobdella robusta TaxID=6412 RepID=T1FA81_HELRO|nr:hypothetical protein HELRODRAFT_176158 [Helobdella robusta]ESO00293.1 hypothetical protein HELRODRAFT_176158 [Helobdella robusta]